jgi:lipoprotein-anchoring transpeptidase ErfK/SrfK
MRRGLLTGWAAVLCLLPASAGAQSADDAAGLKALVEQAVETPPASTDAAAPSTSEAAPASALPGAEPANEEAATAEADARGGPTMQELEVDAVNAAVFNPDAESIKDASPLILKAQVLLDRAGASPGVIDSYYGANVAKAIAAVETTLDLPVDGLLDPQVWDAIGGDNAPPALITYAITEEDLAGPFLESVPADYSKQAKLKSLAYAGPAEMLAERFHMDVDLLKALNPEADFNKAGTSITVADIGTPLTGKVARIDVDKKLKQLRAYDKEDRLVVAYPATIGSDDNPSPTGTHKVDAVVADPFYNYDPKNFVQGHNMKKLSLPPGPNNPVGNIWIGLTEPGYGIHGTPEPSRIDKAGSHGCVRLTNWDAGELAAMVDPGVEVRFIE